LSQQRCQYCGRQIQSGDFFCSLCGIFLPKSEEYMTSDSVRFALNAAHYFPEKSAARKLAYATLGFRNHYPLFALYFTESRVAAINIEKSGTLGAIPQNLRLDKVNTSYCHLPLQEMIMNNDGSFEITYLAIRSVRMGDPIFGQDEQRLTFKLDDGKTLNFGVSKLQAQIATKTFLELEQVSPKFQLAD
jgi:hypothetical protein